MRHADFVIIQYLGESFFFFLINKFSALFHQKIPIFNINHNEILFFVINRKNDLLISNLDFNEMKGKFEQK